MPKAALPWVEDMRLQMLVQLGAFPSELFSKLRPISRISGGDIVTLLGKAGTDSDLAPCLIS